MSKKQIDEIINEFISNEEWLKNFISGSQENAIYNFFNSNRRDCTSILKAFSNLKAIINNGVNEDKASLQEKIKQYKVFFENLGLLTATNERYSISEKGNLFGNDIHNYEEWNKNKKWAFSTLFIFSNINDEEYLINTYREIEKTLYILSNEWNNKTENFCDLLRSTLQKIQKKELFVENMFNNEISLSLLFFRESQKNYSLLKVVKRNNIVEELKLYFKNYSLLENHLLKERFLNHENYKKNTFVSECFIFLLSFLKFNKINISNDLIKHIFGINSNDLKELEKMNSLSRFFSKTLNSSSLGNNINIEEDFVEPYDRERKIELNEFKLNNEEKKRTSTTSIKNYHRNKHLVTLIAQKYNYLCSIDSNHISFISKSSQENYIEVHHLVPLSCKYKKLKDIELDVTVNLFPLCPNCHKKIHLAENLSKIEIIKKLHEIQRLEIANYINKYSNNKNDVTKKWEDVELTIEDYKKIYKIK
ncbi:MAG: HNH endonuclease [Mycoplasmataceae bacterium]|nr:HNH endonuclease [Mycoplasmataceae bacterium]